MKKKGVNTYYSDKKGFVYLVSAPKLNSEWEAEHKDYNLNFFVFDAKTLSNKNYQITLELKT